MKAFTYRLYPTRAQSTEMQRHLDIARELYNACLEERREAWDQGVSLNYYDQARQLGELRRQCSDISSVNCSILQAICWRVQRSYEHFYRRCTAGEQPGYPRFKNAYRFDSITFPQYGNGCRLAEQLYLQNIGHVRIKLHRPFEGAVKTVTLKRDGPRWFAIFTCATDPHLLPSAGAAVGIDLGLTHFLTTDGGETVESPRYFRKAQGQLRQSQRSLMRKRQGGSNRRKQRAHVAERHRKVRNARRDFHHKTARALVDRFDVICHEALDVRNLVLNHTLAKSISDAGWASFIAILRAKAEEAGRVCIAVNPAGTSQTCLCGARVEKDLSQRWHDCPVCGLSLPRDQVSAMLIKRLGQSRCSVTESGTATVLQETVAFG